MRRLDGGGSLLLCDTLSEEGIEVGRLLVLALVLALVPAALEAQRHSETLAFRLSMSNAQKNKTLFALLSRSSNL